MSGEQVADPAALVTEGWFAPASVGPSVAAAAAMSASWAFARCGTGSVEMGESLDSFEAHGGVRVDNAAW